MGCRTEPAAVHIAHVLQRLHFFQFFNFFLYFTRLTAKKITRPYRKKKFNFFFIIYTTYRKKKLHAFSAKKITLLDNSFFVHDLHFSQCITTLKAQLGLGRFVAHTAIRTGIPAGVRSASLASGASCLGSAVVGGGLHASA